MRRLVLAAAAALVGCGDEPVGKDEAEVVVDTAGELAWRQYRENLAFAKSYRPRCERTAGRPGVLVTGFGRFRDKETNASGQAVAELSGSLAYPFTKPPPRGAIDPPGPQTAVALDTLPLDDGSEIDLCAMVLPVFWDLAAILVLKEAAVFAPDVVVMNGVGGKSQPVWLELGATNRAMRALDGSEILQPIEEGAPLVPQAAPDETLRGNLASWQAVRAAAVTAIEAHANVTKDVQSNVPLGKVIYAPEGAEPTLLAGYPRRSNTYLCNNTTYVVSWAMDHPGVKLRLLEASDAHGEGPQGVDIALARDFSKAPRWFVHWPSTLAGDQLGAAAEVLRAMIEAQLAALASGEEPPTRGDNSMAEVPPS
jgi:hypothetical protein